MAHEPENFFWIVWAFKGKLDKDANGDTPISWGSWYLRDADVLRLLIYEGVAAIH